MKSISSTAIAISLCVALLVGGCSRSPSSAIEHVLNKCANDAKFVNQSTMSSAQAATYLADEWQKTDTRDCPPEFREAFQEHVNAWREASTCFSEDTPLNAFLEGFASGYTQDPSLFGASHQKAAIAAQNINSTYDRLVNIAAAYGARVPTSYVNK